MSDKGPNGEGDGTSGGSWVDLIPKGNDAGVGKLYDIDTPGCSTQLGININHTAETYINFNQYAAVSLGGAGLERCSDIKKWSYAAKVDADRAQGQVILNQIKTSHIQIPDTPSVLLPTRLPHFGAIQNGTTQQCD